MENYFKILFITLIAIIISSFFIYRYISSNESIDGVRECHPHEQFDNNQPIEQEGDNDDDEEDDEEEEEEEETRRENAQLEAMTHMTDRQIRVRAKRAERKLQRQMRREYLEQREAKKKEKRREAKEAQAKAEALEEEEAELATSKRKAKEEAELDEWAHLFEVKEEGSSKTDDQNMDSAFIDLLSSQRVTRLDQVASTFQLDMNEVVSRIQLLLKDNRLCGILDDRGKFIFLTLEQMKWMADTIQLEGRLSIVKLRQLFQNYCLSAATS